MKSQLQVKIGLYIAAEWTGLFAVVIVVIVAMITSLWL